ncbi:MAG: alanine--tRNA ligase [Candidatus Cloacimonadota bacterium]|nr:MAG: alanine--tRNA ligase [Candidatus Cloacimonadota bacterium]
MLKSNEIRRQFIDFFIEKKHKEVKSSPVIPINDPTLLFTNAGMNQFKNIFLGKAEAEFPRAVNSQKCIRAGGKHNDLEEVGKDGYHHTFFEMLGNWSFGDYYKKEAIKWAWELLTDVWKLPKDKLYATVHKSDSEAFGLWKTETDIDPTHIEYHGDKDNFWEMATTGPCGPCSEIHIDRGEEFCNLKDDPNHKCKVNGDCHRFIELWNLVFIQYNREEDGTLSPLPQKFVDTGAGFERIVQVLQHKDSNYHTDLFMPIIDKISEISKIPYEANDNGTSHRVIADHIRALSFALADGGMPSNEGRGYVLRRILRRAARHGRILGLKQPFLYLLVDTVAELMGNHYPELNEKKTHIKMIIKAEEERFNLTLDKGLNKFKEIIENASNKLVSGKDAFMLYDTYGFPLDLTKVMAEEKGFSVDEKGFNEEMEKQKQRAREHAKFEMKSENVDWIEFSKTVNSEFVGYEKSRCECRIIKYFIDDDNNVRIVLDKTPFYAESGGQVADTGKIFNDECELEISDVQKEEGIFIHFGKLKSGEIVDKPYIAEIDFERRKNIARNHTATHLLHKALKEVLGEHVQQKGSLVNNEHLRFDFTQFKQVSKRELDIIEKIVNRKVRECLPVKVEIKKLEEARKEGATALFGEKYGDEVRVVSIGDYSKELCGGTHLNYTGEIGLFKITSESSIAAGIRRIEAITGEKAEEYVKLMENEFDEIGRFLNTPQFAVMEKLRKLISENKELHLKIRSFRLKSAGNTIDTMVNRAIEVNGVKVVAAKININNPGELRQIGDQLRNKLKSGIGVLITEAGGKVSILTIVTKDLTANYHAGKIAGKVAEIVGGRGGGRPDMAMAGGKDISKIKEAIKQVPEIIENL